MEINLTDYYPKAVNGNRWETGNPSYNHHLSLKSYYEWYFNNDNSRLELERDMESAHQILVLIARICYCARLAKERNEAYQEVRKNFEEVLSNFHIHRQYGRNMQDINEESFSAFKDRLFGRMIVLGCFLFNDMNISSIHHLLLNVKIDFKVDTDSDSAYRYIQKCFYIEGLKNIKQEKKYRGQRVIVKQQIFDNLSKMEKAFLLEFSSTAIEEARNGVWIKSKDDRTWLIEEVLEKVWKLDI